MKKFILIILMFLPVFVDAICDNNLRKEGMNLAYHITEEVSYNSSSNTFSVTLENIQDGMRVEYLNRFYKENNGKVVISDLKEGASVRINIYYKDGCDDPVDIINKNIPYYNRYYKSYLCDGYDNSVYECSAQFSTYYVDENLVLSAIKNYNEKKIPVEKVEEKKKVKEKTVQEKVRDFTNKWAIKIILVVLSSLVSIFIWKSKYIKEVHGV